MLQGVPVQGCGAHAEVGCSKDPCTGLGCSRRTGVQHGPRQDWGAGAGRSVVQHGPMQDWDATRTPIRGWGAHAGVGCSMNLAVQQGPRTGLGCSCRTEVQQGLPYGAKVHMQE